MRESLVKFKEAISKISDENVHELYISMLRAFSKKVVTLNLDNEVDRSKIDSIEIVTAEYKKRFPQRMGQFLDEAHNQSND